MLSSLLCTRTIPADLDTPLTAYLKLCGNRPYRFLFESVEGGQARGRYSFLGCDPDIVWTCQKGVAYRNGKAETRPPLESLRAVWAECQLKLPEGMPPMASGLFGYLGYAVVRWLENSIPDTKPDPLDIEDAILVRPRLLAIYDTVKDSLLLITPKAEDGQSRLEEAVQRLRAPLSLISSEPWVNGVLNSDLDEKNFCRLVEKAKEYIGAGDIFQVVLSRRITMDFGGTPLSFYRALRHLNPSPFLFLLEFPNFALAGSSPEILVRVREGQVTLRPLAGTRARGKNEAEDRRLEQELLLDAKECAEHLMLLDLGRNDVGRVTVPGSVRVPAQFIVERYSHVMHISSTVEGQLAQDKDALDAILAGFPAGTVSGAPKIRACQIIDELEPVRRGFYAGAVGYLGAGGDVDTCIALRTVLFKNGQLVVQSGAGIVADSDPVCEFVETENKAGAMLKAADMATSYR
jgi:anthranilate synthase component 1